MTDDRSLSQAGAAPDSALRWRSNPRSDLDYIVLLEGTAAAAGCRVRLRYVPDKLILDSASFADRLATMAPAAGAHFETLALALLDEINNEIVPRWVQIVASADAGAPTAETVVVTDRQPNWDNPDILNTLPAL